MGQMGAHCRRRVPGLGCNTLLCVIGKFEVNLQLCQSNLQGSAVVIVGKVIRVDGIEQKVRASGISAVDLRNAMTEPKPETNLWTSAGNPVINRIDSLPTLFQALGSARVRSLLTPA